MINPFTISTRRNKHVQKKRTSSTHHRSASTRVSIQKKLLLYNACSSASTSSITPPPPTLRQLLRFSCMITHKRDDRFHNLSVRKSLWHKLLLHPDWMLLLVPQQQVYFLSCWSRSKFSFTEGETNQVTERRRELKLWCWSFHGAAAAPAMFLHLLSELIHTECN